MSYYYPLRAVKVMNFEEEIEILNHPKKMSCLGMGKNLTMSQTVENSKKVRMMVVNLMKNPKMVNWMIDHP